VSPATAPSDWILAIDGGQSSTACVLGRLDGTLLSCGLAGPAAVPNPAASRPLLQDALAASIGQALAAVSPAPDGFAAAYLGLTGQLDNAEPILAGLIQAQRIRVESDAVAALASGTYGGPGATVMAGTGSVAFAQNERGETCVRGGWGYLLGDEGSGFWIGLQAIRLAIRAQENGGTPTPLVQQVQAALRVDDLRDILPRFYSDDQSRPQVARLAPLVLSAAAEQDQQAAAIVDQAASELAALAQTICSAAQFCAPAERIIVPAGGILKPSTPVYARFTHCLRDRLPEFRVVAPRFPPVVGGFILGLKLAGAPITPRVIERISASLAALPADRLK